MSSIPNMTYTDQFIMDGQQAPISVRDFFDTRIVQNAQRPGHYFRTSFGDFFLDHWEQLKVAAQPYYVNETLYYQPKTLSLLLYGTTELWLSILRVNGMKNITEFHQPWIMVYEPAKIKELIEIFQKRDQSNG